VGWLTQTCAESQLTANAQPAQVTGEERCYNYEVQEDLRVVHSYKLIRKILTGVDLYVSIQFYEQSACYGQWELLF